VPEDLRRERTNGPLLEASALDKVYGTGDAATHALRNVSFRLAEGEFASIIGQSGSGKSTLLNLLGLLDTPSSGSITYRGRDMSALGKQERAGLRGSLIGFVFQFHHLLPEFTVMENVIMPTLISRQLPEAEAREQARETLLTLGLEGLEGKSALALSGGQKQRVAIARALMNRPALLLADEPTGNLDTTNTGAVYELFRRINVETGTAFLIVTHDRAVAQQTDRILEVRDGALVQDVRNAYLDAPA
jgi:lipoprotein-releasing system ATP-binding protein